MTKFAITAAALLAIAAFASAPARAGEAGGPTAKNGQCWLDHSGRDERYGMWQACPQTASATTTSTTTATAHRKHKAASR